MVKQTFAFGFIPIRARPMRRATTESANDNTGNPGLPGPAAVSLNRPPWSWYFRSDAGEVSLSAALAQPETPKVKIKIRREKKSFEKRMSKPPRFRKL